MSTQNAYEINGVIDTSKTVLTNMNDMCTASGCWLTYDITTGLWSVVINQAGSSVKSFDDSNIIGSISISGTGINEAYNKVSVQFPHKDLKDQTDYIDLVIPEEDRFPNEIDNTLTMSLTAMNDPVQAQYIGAVELKQSRVDRIVNFRTDYSVLGLRAGDLIDITSDMYGYSAKMFRITKITEDDKDDGTIELSITALEYDSNVYNSDGLIREVRDTATGIVPKSANSVTAGIDKIGNTNVVFSFATGGISIAETLASTTDQDFLGALPNSGIDRYATGFSTRLPATGTYSISYQMNWAAYYDYDGSGVAIVPNGIRKLGRINITRNGAFQDCGIQSRTSIAKLDDVLADLTVNGLFQGNAGDIIVFYVDVRSDLGPNHPDVSAVSGANAYSIVYLTASLAITGA